MYFFKKKKTPLIKKLLGAKEPPRKSFVLPGKP